MLGPTAHLDSFARDRLPPEADQPDYLLDGLDYPEWMNAAVELTDRMVARGFGDHTALIGNGRRRTYKELSDWTNRLANALESATTASGPATASSSAPPTIPRWSPAGSRRQKPVRLSSTRCRCFGQGELAKIVDKAEITTALCDTRIVDELVSCAKDSTLPEEGDRF